MIAAVRRFFIVALLASILLGPLMWLVWTWTTYNGLPTFIDNGETYLSYMHAQSLQRYPISETWLVTIEDANLADVIPRGGYLHNPNGPRYAHWLLLSIGIRSLTSHILILSTAMTLAGLLCLLALVRRLGYGAGLLMLALPMAFALDTMGFLAWASNTYRVFSYVLLWGLLAAVAGPSRGWLVGLAAFVVCQFEYGFALFALGAACTFAVLLHGRRAGATLGWMALGTALSLAVFGVQAIGFSGAPHVWYQFGQALARRGPGLDNHDNPVMVTWTALAGHYNEPIPWAVLWSLATAPVALLWRRCPPFCRALAALQVALVVGLAATALFLRGYYLDAFVAHTIPGFQFLATVAVATVAVQLGFIVGAAGRLFTMKLDNIAGAVGLAVAAGAMLVNVTHVYEKYPPPPQTFVSLLESRYAGKPFLSPVGYYALTFALTGASAGSSAYVVTLPLDANQEVLRMSDGELYYFCAARPRASGPTECDDAAEKMKPLGHVLLDRGPDFVIMQLAR